MNYWEMAEYLTQRIEEIEQLADVLCVEPHEVTSEYLALIDRLADIEMIIVEAEQC